MSESLVPVPVPVQLGKGVISAGSFGCVNKPAIQCLGDISRVPYSISKRMNYEQALFELKIGKKIEKMDPYHYFSLKAPRMCIPGKITEEDTNLSKMKSKPSSHTRKRCSKKLSSKDRLLIMEDAGIDLYTFSSKIQEKSVQDIHRLYKTSPESSIYQFHTELFIYKEIYRIILGLTVMNANGMVHNDVRYPNVLIHPRTGQLRLIDYSISFTYDEFFNDLKTQCGHTKQVYPPETCLMESFPYREIPYLGSKGGLRPIIRRILMDILNMTGKGKTPEEFHKLIQQLKEQGEYPLVKFLKIQGNSLERDYRNREIILMLLDLNRIRTQEDFQGRLFMTVDSYMSSFPLKSYIDSVLRYSSGLKNTPIIQGIYEILKEMRTPELSLRLTTQQALKKLEELRYRIGGERMDKEFRRIHKIPEMFLQYIK
jgi:serine/threonine protein kinase